MGRYVAKNVVAAGLADRCEVQFAYAIGYPDPVSIHIDTFGTAKVAEERDRESCGRSIFIQARSHREAARPAAGPFIPRPRTMVTLGRMIQTLPGSTPTRRRHSRRRFNLLELNKKQRFLC
jgi:hypothetical protein